jgi:hypothetical protein
MFDAAAAALHALLLAGPGPASSLLSPLGDNAGTHLHAHRGRVARRRRSSIAHRVPLGVAQAP